MTAESEQPNTTTPKTTVVDDEHAGHLGYLTPSQQESLTIFREALIKAELYKPATDFAQASHDETTLLRFLRARGFLPDAAQKQFYQAEMWRKQHNVNALYHSFDEEEMETSKKFYPRWTGRRDKHGLPLYVYRIASLEPIQGELYSVPAERRYHRIIALYELMTRFSFPFCSHLPHPSSPTPISSSTSIIDLENASFSSMWKLRSHFQEASRLATANYPETLSTIAIVNSPSYFPTVWSWIKGWFDEGTRHKIHVLGKDPAPTLTELIHAKDLPKLYGGELDWKYEDEPILDEDARLVLQSMPRGPVVFVDGKAVRASLPLAEQNDSKL